MENKNNTHWTDTEGIAKHFDLKPGTLRKQRSKQIENSLPFHKVGGNIRYNILECEKHVERNKREF